MFLILIWQTLSFSEKNLQWFFILWGQLIEAADDEIGDF